MPLVLDPVTGKYVAKKARPPSAQIPEPDPQQTPGEGEPSAFGSQELDAVLTEMAGQQQSQAAADAMLARANATLEMQRRKAAAAEATLARLEQEQALVAGKSTSLERMLATKTEELKVLEAKLATAEAEREQAIHSVSIQVQEAVAATKRAEEDALAHKESEWQQAMSAAEQQAEAHLAASLEEAQAAHEMEIAELKAAQARELGATKTSCTQEVAELVAALNKRERLKNSAASGEATKAAKRANAKVVTKAQAKVESWEIANIGRQQIELMHAIHEMLESLSSAADLHASHARPRLPPPLPPPQERQEQQQGQEEGRPTYEAGSENEQHPEHVRLREQAHRVLETVEATRDKLYAQLYSQENLLGCASSASSNRTNNKPPAQLARTTRPRSTLSARDPR